MQDSRSLGAQVEFTDNPEQRCLCVLLLDVSNSMSGAPIQSLNEGIAAFKTAVEEDEVAALRVEVAIVAFSHEVATVQEPVTVDKFTPPLLEADGGTRMAAGINVALDLVENRKQVYRDNGIAYLRPWVMMITDGYPEHDSAEDIQKASENIKQAVSGDHVVFFAIGVQGADMQKLADMVPPERPPLLLSGLKFAELFAWLGNSLQTVSGSGPGEVVNLLPPDMLTVRV